MDWLEDYKKLLSFASISTEAEFKKEVLACFDWVKKEVEKLGFETEVWKTPGHPTLFAAGPKVTGKPTILIYNHYDVQPVDPLDLWATPPFEPTVREGVMYARGAQDNKGQLFYVLLALKKIKEKEGDFPLNIKLLIEGEEEMGSKNLPHLLKKHESQLKADYVAIVDCGIPDSQTPAVSLGLRGLITMDVEVTGTLTDLHSGSHGGLAYNPNLALVEILASAKDKEGRVTIPGFYDAIQELTPDEKKGIHFAFDEAGYQTQYGTTATGGEKKYSPRERNWLRPTLEINGLSGGYCGKGFKTVIPSKASAKLSCRLVRGQDPQKVATLVAHWIESQAPAGIQVKVNVHEGFGQAVLTSPYSKGIQAFATAFSEVFQKPCQFTLEGATIPITADLQKVTGGEVILVGLGLNSDQIHAPNEHFSLDRIEKGQKIISQALKILSK